MNIFLALTCALIGAAAGTAGRTALRRSPLRMSCGPPWCELASAILSATLGWRTAVGLLPWWWLPVPLCLTWFAVPLTIADLTHRRLPNLLTLPAYPILGLTIAVAAATGPDPGLGLRALAAAAVFGGAHALVRAIAPAAMGGGDVKLAGSLGAVLGALGWSTLAAAAALAAGITVVLAIVTRSRSAPHGPGLLAATWLLAAFPGGFLPATG